ncbi:MAG: hypothetical protein ACOVSW_02320 [Candidatus Kapaibacteriota bacterium]|jgi:hypothetical protein
MLVLGFTAQERPLHLQVSASNRALIKLITVYEPDALDWINFRTRIRKA